MPTRRHSTSFGGAAYYTISTHADSTRTRAYQPTTQRKNALPYSLQNAVPSCARSCLQTYISQELSGCSNNENLTCLCTKYSSEGYTLGELAFICLEEGCSSSTYDEQQDTYGICSNQAGAVSATHSTLTLPPTATTTSGVTTTTVELYITTSTYSPRSTSSSQLTPQASDTASSSASPAVTGTALPMASAATSTSSTTTSSTVTAAAATSSHKSITTTLTSAQAIGVSVAAFGGLALIMITIWLCACFRRRKNICKSPNSKHDSYDFIDDAPPRFSPFNYGYADPRGPLGGFAERRAELPDEKRAKSQWYREQFPNRTSEKHGAVGFDFIRDLENQKSQESLRTLSQLLPDKPGSTPPRPPSKRFPVRPRSPDTVFEEDKTPKMSAPPRVIGLPARPKPAKRRSGTPQELPQQGPQFAPQLTRSPDQARQPSLSIELPRKASRIALKVPSPVAIIPPPIPSADRTSRGSRAKSRASSAGSGSLLDYYTSPTEIEKPLPTPRHPLGSPLTPISLEPQRRIKPTPAAIRVTKPTYPPRAVRQSTDSYKSDTSFESTDPDEPTPPEEDKQLSPVAEHSPIAGIKYPKIPRSSNQAVPRSPAVKLSPGILPWQIERQTPKDDDRTTLPSHARQVSSTRRSPRTPEQQAADANTLSGTTLAAKRRGDSEAKDLEKRLVIDTSHSRANSHHKNTQGHSDQRSTASTPPRRSGRTSRQESPLKGYGRVTSSRTASSGLLSPEMKSPGPTVVRYVRGPDGITAQEVKLKSPLWEPKLTPSRRGEDLVLEVGMASPGMVTPGLSTPGVGRAR